VTVWRDNTAPSLTINENNFSVGVNSASLTGTTFDNLANPPHPLPGIGWANNRGGSGAGVVNVGGTWSANITGLQTGANVITVTSTDAAGNPTQASRTIFYDVAAPSVLIGSPATGFISTSATVLISGSATDNDAVNTITAKNVTPFPNTSFVVNVAAPGLPSASANWSSTVTLVQGTNTIQITATDRVGLSNTSSIIVWYDANPPSVAITNPATNPFLTGTSTITLSGTASDLLDTGIQSVDWSAPTGSGSTTLSNPGATSTGWTSPLITLNPGDNLITVTAKDKANRTASTSITIILSSIAPSIVVSTPRRTRT
jgi:hypothetical protein